MPRYSDSNYAAVTRKRRYGSHIPTVALSDGVFVTNYQQPTAQQGGGGGTSTTSSLPWMMFDWIGDALEADDVDITRHEAAVAPLLEEGELDADAIVVSPTGNSSSAATVASERRRREDGWNDLALDPFVEAAAHAAASSAAAASAAAAGATAAGAGATDVPPGESVDDDNPYDPASPGGADDDDDDDDVAANGASESG